jgi:antitoxin component of RelBE/YafQ-DinJ toxin-antitoxin module
MATGTHRSRKAGTLNFRVDRALKAEFMAATEAMNKPVAEVLREFMHAFIAHTRKKKFTAEARRQSRLLANSPDSAEVMNWIEDVSATEDRK